MSPHPMIDVRQQQFDRIIPIAVLVGLTATLVSARASTIAFGLLVLLPLAMLWRKLGRGGLASAAGSPLVATLAVFGIYIAANAGWSTVPEEAFGKVFAYWVLLSTGVLASRGLSHLDDQSLERLSHAVLIGLGIGTAYLLIELLSDLWIQRSLFNLFPFLRPGEKHAKVVDGVVAHIGDYVLNRNLAILSLSLWPALLIIRAHLTGATAWFVALLLYGVAVVGVFSSEHETSMLALLFSTVVFVGMLSAPHVMRAAVMTGWIVATMLVVPIAMAAYKGGMHQAGWIPDTGQQRIILWNVAAEKVLEAPILGVGVASTRDLDDQTRATAERRPGHNYAQRTGRHSHNVFMQVWFELGAVGAIVLMALGLVLLRQFRHLPPNVEPFAVASFVSAVLVGAFSYGIWQVWFMAGFGLWALLLCLGLEGAKRAGILTPR